MKNFVISVICLSILIGAWAWFDYYSDETLKYYIHTIESETLPSIERSQWKKASDSFRTVEQDWHHYKEYAAFFLDTQTINQADFSLARAKFYIKEEDRSNAAGELSCLKEQLTFLHSNEALTLGNLL